MKVRECMSRDVEIANPDQSIREAAMIMARIDAGAIPVADGDRLVGMLTDRDIAVRAVAEGNDLSNATAGDYMTKPVTTVPDTCNLDDVAKVMEQAQIRRVVVVDGKGCVAGIVAQADIALAGRDGKTAEIVKQVSEPGRSSQ